MSTTPAAVLWDMDGTLVDTEPFWIRAEHDLVARFGGRWSDDLAHELVGNPLLVSADFIIEHSPVTLTPHAVVDDLMRSVIAQVREHVPWRPGAQALLAEALAVGIPNALVTMSWRPLVAAVLDTLGPGTFAAVVTGEEVTHGKPHPEPYERAVALLGIDPADAVAVEDSPTGVRSATAAGVPTIAVPHVVPVPPIDGSVRLETLEGVSLADLVARARSPFAADPQSSGW